MPETQKVPESKENSSSENENIYVLNNKEQTDRTASIRRK